MKRKLIKKLIIVAPIVLGAALILVFAWVRTNVVFEKGEEKIFTASTLTEAIDIAELSTAQFTYNGIAEMYKDKANKKLLCNVLYKAKVKAGIDMKAVEFDINQEEKFVKVRLPEVKISSNLIDEERLSFLPENAKVNLNDVLAVCKADAEKEAMQSGKLLESAKENLKSVIEALLYPILSKEGYELVWVN